jgi:hypothetical protein
VWTLWFNGGTFQLDATDVRFLGTLVVVRRWKRLIRPLRHKLTPPPSLINRCGVSLKVSSSSSQGQQDGTLVRSWWLCLALGVASRRTRAPGAGRLLGCCALCTTIKLTRSSPSSFSRSGWLSLTIVHSTPPGCGPDDSEACKVLSRSALCAQDFRPC